MSGRHQPLNGADSAVTYRVPLRSLDSDHTFDTHIRVFGPLDLQNHLYEIRLEYPDYAVGTPVPE